MKPGSRGRGRPRIPGLSTERTAIRLFTDQNEWARELDSGFSDWVRNQIDATRKRQLVDRRHLTAALRQATGTTPEQLADLCEKHEWP